MPFRSPRFGRIRVYSLVLLLGLAVAAGLLWPLVHRYLRAAALLLHIQDPKTTSLLVRSQAYVFDEIPVAIETPAGPVPARRYLPHRTGQMPSMVVLHGIHHLGIEEPRLMNFSRALAAGGIEVLTPELRSLADYRVSPSDVAVIGAASHWLHQHHRARPGILGLSFAGGLALVAAADPRFAPDIGMVAAIGAHDDLERVCRYLATGRSPRPDGTILDLPSHEYGLLVLVYAHVEDFFSPQDTAIARNILRLQLWEKMDQARSLVGNLSPAGQTKILALLDHRNQEVAAEALAKLPLHAAEMAAVSPHSPLAQLHLPVLLLHGAGDNVIPPSESLWLAHDLPQSDLRSMLISPLITHVELGGRPGWKDKAALLRFMATMLYEEDEL